jgi:uncharacterized tellurite resistance protein B-like protein
MRSKSLFNLKKRLAKKLPAEADMPEQNNLERVRTATCVILLEVARSDDEFSSIEKTTVSAIMKKRFDLPEEAIEELLEIARRKREESVDIWQFTNMINQNYSKKERIRIVEEAWKIIYADDKLDMYEDHFVHKLAKLLRLKHGELIEAKLKVKLKRRS